MAWILQEQLPPGDTLFSPSQILEELGLAASRQHADPVGFVWGRERNLKEGGSLARAREKSYGAALAGRQEVASALDISISSEVWGMLSPEERDLLQSFTLYPAKTIALRLGITVKAAQRRIARAQEKLNELLETL